MKVLIDMNLSPDWVNILARYGIEGRHWLTVGDPRAPDHEIMRWANENGYVVFTHDLDFGAILAATQARGPSVLQIRSRNILPAHSEKIVVDVLLQYAEVFEGGALITINEVGPRVRVLPFRGLARS